MSGLLDQVAAGEEFLITRRGKAVARLCPIKPTFDRAKAKQAAQMLLKVRKGVTLNSRSIKKMINEGRM